MAFNCRAPRVTRVANATIVAACLLTTACSTEHAARRAGAQQKAADASHSQSTTAITTTAPNGGESARATTGPPLTGASGEPLAAPGIGYDAPSTTPPPPSDLPAVAATSDDQIATGLGSSPRCDPPGTRTAVAVLSWSPAASGTQQRVELTKVQNGFESGRYEASPLLPANATSFTWTAVNANGIHTWRVMTQHGSQWAPSGTDQFTGPVCVGDLANPGS